jgi:hypothetical protein
MSGRFWFYLAAVIIVAGIGTANLASTRRLENELIRQDKAALATSQEELDLYLTKQSDSRKLVALALLYEKTRPELVRPVALRAFELNKDSRDIAVLAAPYSEEAKERVHFLDPLYQDSGTNAN